MNAQDYYLQSEVPINMAYVLHILITFCFVPVLVADEKNEIHL